MRYFDPASTTKTEATKERYQKQADQLKRRYIKEEGDSGNADFVNWLINLRPTLSASSWRSYKSSVVWYLTERGHDDLASHLLQHSGTNVSPKPSPQSKSVPKKKKSVTEREEALITDYLRDKQGVDFWATRAAAFFQATLLVGLRPVEWQSTSLIMQPEEGVDGPFPVLKVKNAKATNGRAHGEYRHLHLHEFEPDDIKRVMVAILFADQSNPKGWLSQDGQCDTWDEFYGRIRRYFGRVVTRLFPGAKRRVSFYSCRHQFIADLKASNYSREEIAALAGHAVDDTAAEHYGRKRSGRTGKSRLPTANPDEVKRIRTASGTTPSPSSRSPT